MRFGGLGGPGLTTLLLHAKTSPTVRARGSNTYFGAAVRLNLGRGWDAKLDLGLVDRIRPATASQKNAARCPP
jgi:hypothetical protein